MTIIAVIHARGKSRDALTTGALKKGVVRSHGAASGMSTDSLLSSFLPISSVPTNSILPTRALTMLPVSVLTEQAPSTQVRLTQPMDILIEHPRATQAHIALPLHALTGHTCETRALTTLPAHVLTEHALATIAPHIRIALPAGVLAGSCPRTYHEDSERPGFFTGIAAFDHDIGSIPKAALTQVCAPRSMSSGRAAILCSLLAQTTDAEELCALIDAGGCFNPGSAATAGVDLSRLLWVRCGRKTKAVFAEKLTAHPHATAVPHATAHSHPTAVSHATTRPHSTAVPHARARLYTTLVPRSTTDRDATTDRNATTNSRVTTDYQSMTDSRGTNGHYSATGSNRNATSSFRGADAQRMQPIEQAFKAADILIQNGGFGLIAIDLGEIEERLVRKIPLTTWFRFARVIERRPTALVVFATYPAAQGCAALTLHLKNAAARWHTGAHAHAQFFSGLACEVELGKARGRGRKPAYSAKASFAANPVWK
jgi:recombination protein RecA